MSKFSLNEKEAEVFAGAAEERAKKPAEQRRRTTEGSHRPIPAHQQEEKER